MIVMSWRKLKIQWRRLDANGSAGANAASSVCVIELKQFEEIPVGHGSSRRQREHAFTGPN
jgi:hypothetical protein